MNAPTESHKFSKEQVYAALCEANEICRTMGHIAERDGKETNWVAFRNHLQKQLIAQHMIMYPETYAHVSQPIQEKVLNKFLNGARNNTHGES